MGRIRSEIKNRITKEIFLTKIDIGDNFLFSYKLNAPIIITNDGVRVFLDGTVTRKDLKFYSYRSIHVDKDHPRKVNVTSEEMDIVFTDYFFSNIHYLVNKHGFYYPSSNVTAFDEDFTLEISPTELDPLKLLDEEIFQKYNFQIYPKNNFMHIKARPILRIPWLYFFLDCDVYIVIDIKLIVGMKGTWPYPSILPIFKELNLLRIKFSFFGLEFDISEFHLPIEKWVKKQATLYIIKSVFNKEK